MRLALAATFALLLAACEKCDSCKDGASPSQKPASPTPPAGAPAAAKTTAPAVEPEEPKHVKPDVKVAFRGTGKTIELSVWEMECEGCSAQVEDAFAAVPGVAAAKADFASSLVKVELTDAQKRDAVIALLTKALADLNQKEGKDFQVLGK